MQDERGAKQCIAFRQRAVQFADRADGLVPVTGGQDRADFVNQIARVPQSIPENVKVRCDGHRLGFGWQCCHSPFLLMSRLRSADAYRPLPLGGGQASTVISLRLYMVIAQHKPMPIRRVRARR